MVRRPVSTGPCSSGKRLAVYPDCKNSKVGMSELLRNVTSGDPVSVEFKNKDPFTAALRIKLLIGANEKPEVTTGPADTSRLIYIEVGKSKNTDDPTWKERLENGEVRTRGRRRQ